MPATYLALTEEVMSRDNGALGLAAQPPIFHPLRQFSQPAGKRNRTVHVFGIHRDALPAASGG